MFFLQQKHQLRQQQRKPSFSSVAFYSFCISTTIVVVLQLQLIARGEAAATDSTTTRTGWGRLSPSSPRLGSRVPVSVAAFCEISGGSSSSRRHCHRHRHHRRHQLSSGDSSSLWKRKNDVLKAATSSSGTTTATSLSTTTIESSSSSSSPMDTIFHDFCDFLIAQQKEIIESIEEMDGSNERFSNDTWGRFSQQKGNKDGSSAASSLLSGGITRVIQNGNIVEKGACSLTVIEQGKLTAERAATIRARQEKEQADNEGDDNDEFPNIQAGDTYSAAALSMVLHTRSPMIPTFRSDVRIFMVQPSSSSSPEEEKTSGSSTSNGIAWFGGGADLTPYYLFDDDIRSFHAMYKTLCEEHADTNDGIVNYSTMKQACDEYFYLPARCEHRGTGGIFFDDMIATRASFQFCKGVVTTWMPSWFPIIAKRRSMTYTEQQKYWQKLRRGRYLEFNLLYDRGVKFGLANANPRVEGVMVSAPPEIAFEYKHAIEDNSEEARLMQILKQPVDWV